MLNKVNFKDLESCGPGIECGDASHAETYSSRVKAGTGLSGELRPLQGKTGAGSFVHKKQVGMRRWEEMPTWLKPKGNPPMFTW